MVEEKKPAEATAEPAETAPAKSSPIKKYGIMLGIVVVAAVGGYFVTLKFIKPMVKGDQATEGQTEEATPEAKPEEHAKVDEHGNPQAHIFEVEDIVVNPAGTGGTRFLSASVGFEVKSETAMKLFQSRQPQIRDALITILGSKNIEQLTDMKQKEIARLQIMKRVEQLLETDQLSAVYFTDFVIQ